MRIITHRTIHNIIVTGIFFSGTVQKNKVFRTGTGTNTVLIRDIVRMENRKGIDRFHSGLETVRTYVQLPVRYGTIP